MRNIQPLELPDILAIIRYNDVAEDDQGDGGDNHAHNQQVAEFRKNGKLGVLLAVRQFVHGVHQALEDPEIDQRVHANR